jgi:hypothetical protein
VVIGANLLGTKSAYHNEMGEKGMEKSYAQVISYLTLGFGHIQNLLTQKSYINIQ